MNYKVTPADQAQQGMKDQVKRNFSRYSNTYEQYAQVQGRAAKELARALRELDLALPEGEILEIGSGTGLFTQELFDLFPRRILNLSDISGEMLEILSQRLPEPERHRCRLVELDGEHPEAFLPQAAILSSFTLQWFTQPLPSLGRLFNLLTKGGILAFAFQEDGSYPEWKAVCRELDLPFTGNPLPRLGELQSLFFAWPAKVTYWQEEITYPYPSSLAFMRSLKMLGAATQVRGRKLKAQQLKELVRHWDHKEPGRVEVTNRVGYFILEKQA